MNAAENQAGVKPQRVARSAMVVGGGRGRPLTKAPPPPTHPQNLNERLLERLTLGVELDRERYIESVVTVWLR
ncbi:hypothetical protein, partial [Nocardia carnea]|uniref:hypothetical protein n=1 Tax=Nocardia carnea TaxID=37328 RepID=UPI002458C5EE